MRQSPKGSSVFCLAGLQVNSCKILGDNERQCAPSPKPNQRRIAIQASATTPVAVATNITVFPFSNTAVEQIARALLDKTSLRGSRPVS